MDNARYTDAQLNTEQQLAFDFIEVSHADAPRVVYDDRQVRIIEAPPFAVLPSAYQHELRAGSVLITAAHRDSASLDEWQAVVQGTLLLDGVAEQDWSRLITAFLSTYPSVVVLDPACGEGKVLRQLRQLGRPCIGLEVDTCAIETAVSFINTPLPTQLALPL